MRWLLNLKIKHKLFVISITAVIFWVLLCCIFFAQILNIRNTLLGSSSELASAINGNITAVIISIVVMTVIFIPVVVMQSIIIARTIERPIKKLSEASLMMSEGVIGGTLSTNRGDEIGQLSRDFDKVLHLLQNLNDDIKEFCNKHHIAGDVYAKINPDNYEGEYKETVVLLNNTVWQYIADGRDLLFLASEYAKGNFNTQIRSFPGTRSVANNVCTGLRKILVFLTQEITRVVSAAADGSFTNRLDETFFKGEWGAVVTQINRLLDSIMEPISETTNVMLEIYEGNVDYIKGDFKGDFGLIKTSVNNAADSIKSYIDEISGILSEISGSNLAVDTGEELTGEYGRIKSEISKLINELNTQIAGIISSSLSIEDGAAELTQHVSQISEGVNKQMEITKNIGDSLENAKDSSIKQMEVAEQATKLSEELVAAALSDSKLIADLLQSMEDADNISNNTYKIIEIIEDVQFQTNHLAMQASFEAAKGADNNKGFTSVADEARSLTARNKSAVEEISAIINSTDMFKGIKEQVSAIMEDFEKIVVSSQSLSNFISQISQHTSLQPETFTKLTEDAAEISNIVNSNAAKVTEVEAVSQKVQQEANSQKALLSQYKLKN